MAFRNHMWFSILGWAALLLSTPGLRLSDDALQAQDGLPGDRKLSADDIGKIARDDTWILVDTRATDAFNGWALDGV
ncbi:MAG: hypothetical protein ABGZ17_28690, partial [Planctomycetaceae bacterium]